MLPALPPAGVTIITNMGAANPVAAAARRARDRRARSGCAACTIAAVTGDDVLVGVRGRVSASTRPADRWPTSATRVVSANAYLGAEPIVEALARGADVVITGRVADPSLFLAPLVHEFGWTLDDWARLGRGTLVGHLLECAAR